MSFLFDEVIFGPVTSRRLGVSLGVNLLPVDYKFCTFDCIYCECGWTNKANIKGSKLPTKEKVKELLMKKLTELREQGINPDAITFAGNGEPTLHPAFADIIDDTIVLRDNYFPNAMISVLSNATMLNREGVFQALKRVDKNILKLDAGTEQMFKLINQPGQNIHFEDIVNRLEAFEGDLIIQTLFLRGKYNNIEIDNTKPEEVDAWIGKLKRIGPQHVMIYPIDRHTPADNLEKVSFTELLKISEKVEAEGIKVEVFS
jgi:wyosine [tRNA(Phe)-imidazoG37] synthetase (radical SAM superfamily)